MLVESPRQIGLVLKRPELPTRSVNLVQDQSLLIRNIKVHPRKIRETSISNSLQQQLRRDHSDSIFVKKLYHRVLSHLPRGQQLPIQVEEEDIPFFAEVIAGGRITIPEEIRKIFGVKDGDHVMCRVRLVKRAEDIK